MKLTFRTYEILINIIFINVFSNYLLLKEFLYDQRHFYLHLRNLVLQNTFLCAQRST